MSERPRLISLCIDANDAPRIAAFWAEALRWTVGGAVDDGIEVVPTDGTLFSISVFPVSESKLGKNRIHIDLTTSSLDDQNATVARLIELGARHIDIGQGPDTDHVVLADPEGNEFCVIEPQNQFLAGAGRLGSITGDGTPANGRFWSAVFGWPLVWDQDDETAIRSPDGTGPFITWGPPVPPKLAKSRWHLDIAQPADADQAAEVGRLIALGARRVDIGQGDVSWVVLTDPDGNEFCLLSPR